MFYTLADAIEDLKGTANVYAAPDLTVLINKAVRALSRMKGWQCLRKVVRFVSDSPQFTLPQGCSGLVRACVNGSPATVRGQDFRFLHSGPGDTDVLTVRRPPPGFTMVRNVVSAGVSPVMSEVTGPFRLFGYVDDAEAGSTASAPALLVTALDSRGRVVKFPLLPGTGGPLFEWPQYGADGYVSSGVEAESADTTTLDLSAVMSVAVGHVESGAFAVGATGDRYITLYAAHGRDYSIRTPIALYHPGVAAPAFRRYSAEGVPPGPFEVLAEVTIDPLPLVSMSDVLPFEALEPVEWMIRADWEMRSGEVSKAEKYREDAGRWLQAQEIADETIQTSVVVNSLYSGSMGELTREMENI